MFTSLLLDEQLLDSLQSLGFEEMTEVQEAAIPLALEGKDLIVNAKTGSGKTLSFVLPMLQQILDNPQSVSQGLILAPTRDLCRQINKQCMMLAQYTDITTTVIIGGEDPKHQLLALEKYPDIIIATPGRLLEHVKREVIDLEAINILVLDEADRMLAMGFSEQVIKVASHCNEECQTVLYSASFTQGKFQALTDSILYEPVEVIVDSERSNNENITQLKIPADDKPHKLTLCEHILQNVDDDFSFNKAIVFANKRITVDEISRWLQSNNIKSAVVHSDVTQDIRNLILRKYRNDEINIIIATDVASRGLDISGLDLIVNFDVPRNGEDYMHRIGRTGRMHKTGMAVTLVNSNEWNQMISIENFLEFKCIERLINGLSGNYSGPENRKTSGKAYGTKRIKKVNKKKPKKNVKLRTRDKKNIGKRRKPKDVSKENI